MANPSLELVVIYEDQRKLIIFESDMCIQAFKQLLKSLFFISVPEDQIKLIDVSKDAEICSEKSFREDREMRVILASNAPSLSTNSSLEEHPQSSSTPLKIEFQELSDKRFEEKTFLVNVNKWAAKYKFKLRFGEGLKSSSKEFKKTLVCSIAACRYKLIFKSLKATEDFRIDEKLSKNYMTHSNCTLIS